MAQEFVPTDVAEVIEFSAGMFNDANLPNAYLAAGWVLLATYVSGDLRSGQTQMYSLGWLKSNGPVVHPEKPKTVWEEKFGIKPKDLFPASK